MRKDFYIFRHGETALNTKHCIQGSGTDVCLTERGQKQALDLAKKLLPYKLEIIYSSPLKRALETAETVAGVIDCDIVIKNDLRECFYGEAEGIPIELVSKKFANVFNNWNSTEIWDIAYPNGESKKATIDRVWKQLEDLIQTPYQNIGVAVHGGTMTSLLNFLKYDFDKIENCAVIHIVYDHKWFVEGGLF